MGSPRAVWKGNLCVGVVTLPVKLYKATDDEDAETKTHEVHTACKGQVNRRNVCFTCDKNGKDVPHSEIGKGVPKGDGTFALLDPALIDAIHPESSDVIAVDTFVPLKELDPLYVLASYYLGADGRVAQEGYATFRAALTNRQEAMQARFCIYGRERTVTIRPVGDVLVLQLMRNANQVRSADDLPDFIRKGTVTVNPAMVKIAEQLSTLYAGHFDATEYEDDYVKGFKAIVENALTGTALPTATATPAPAPAKDLMAALRASLDASTKSGKKKQAKVGAAAALGPKKKKAS